MALPSLPFVFISLFITLHIGPVLGGVPRFGALDNADANINATLLAFDTVAAPGLAPRWFSEGTPAIPAQLVSPNPRHLLLGRELVARQKNDDRPCAPGQHSCAEVDSPGFCCTNDRYCYLNAKWEPKCCSLGLKCPDSVCAADELFCNQTLTSTVVGPAITPGPQHGGGSTDLTSFVSFTSLSACCNRQCGATFFSCVAAFGGQCCPFGFKCASGGRCIEDAVPSTSAPASTVVSEIPAGCTTSQIACATTDGGGCCGVGSVCTTQNIASATSTLACAPNPAGSSGALSSGARAGIGVGVAVGAAIVIGLVTWLCIRRRRRRPRSATPGTSASAHEMRGDAGAYKAASWRARRDAGQDHSLLPTPRTFESGPTSAFAGRGHDYHGPDAIEGPFTDLDGDGRVVYDARLATTTPPAVDGDPSTYFQPDNIRWPVEIGGAEALRVNGRGAREIVPRPAREQDTTTTAGPFELMGTPGSPSPLDSDTASPPIGKDHLPPPSATDAAQKRY
ncbi:hypothetical protein F5X97DRAFT_99987 [Nemania serpens]|nr:hypothetical protein F5X97DRAFT_99987 [Nemania serpens]